MLRFNRPNRKKKITGPEISHLAAALCIVLPLVATFFAFQSGDLMKMAKDIRTTVAMAAEILSKLMSCMVKVETLAVTHHILRSSRPHCPHHLFKAYCLHGSWWLSNQLRAHLASEQRQGTTRKRAKAPISRVRRHSTLCCLSPDCSHSSTSKYVKIQAAGRPGANLVAQLAALP